MSGQISQPSLAVAGKSKDTKQREQAKREERGRERELLFGSTGVELSCV